MDYVMFDNVKFEKVKAIARFKLLRRVKNLWEVLVILMLLTWISKNTPTAIKFSGEVLFKASGYVFNPHVVFVIGNAIIGILFMLCRKNFNGNDSVDCDVYEDYVRHSEALREGVVVTVSESGLYLDEKSAVVDDDGCDVKEMQITVAEEKTATEDVKEMQITVVENVEVVDVEAAIVKATKQIRRCERMQSEKFKAVTPKRELRRSETEIRRSVSSSDDKLKIMTSSVDTVDTLSNEDFNKTIDAFIVKHKQKIRELNS